MKRIRETHNLFLFLIVLLILGLVLSSCGDTSNPVPTLTPLPTSTPLPPTPTPVPFPPTLAVLGGIPSFETASCPFFKLDKVLVEGQNLKCGYLKVLEEHQNPDKGPIKLPVAIVKSTGKAAAEPLVILQGGPGGTVQSIINYFVSPHSPTHALLDNYDLVFLDQRGTVYAQPSLFCDSGRKYTDDIVEFMDNCLAGFTTQKRNLAAYNSQEIAADINDLRTAMGYPRINLYGVSYGTRVALTVMRDFPQILRSVILDATLPLQADPVNAIQNFDHAIKLLFELCTADTSCNTAFPTLKEDFSKAFTQLNAKAVKIKVKFPDDATPKSYDFDGYDFVGYIVDLLYDSEAIPELPLAIHEASKGNYQVFEKLLSPTVYTASRDSLGLKYSVNCSDDYSFSNSKNVQTVAAKVLPEIRKTYTQTYLNAFTICKKWPTKKVSPLENSPVISSVPTLLLVGQLDPITPPSYMHLAAGTLNQSFSYEFPGLGHGAILGEECPTRIAKSFLLAPDKQPDSSCIQQMTLKFITVS